MTRNATAAGSIVATSAAKASGATASTPAEARAWVASARTSRLHLASLPQGGGDAVDGARDLAPRVGARA